ncbi:MAG: ornithine--oxo-acid transaminase [Dehalococcoidia bacterium]
MQGSDAYIREVERVSARNYAPLDVVLHSGEGAWVTDVEGRRYLDMLAAYGAVSHGHQHPRLVAALVQQAQTLAMTSRAFHNDRMGPLLARLCELTGLDRALPMNTGAEAVETAIKAMRKWGYDVKGISPDRAEIIVCANNFHGRTTTIVGFSSDELSREGFGPPTPGFVTIPYNDVEALAAAIGPETCGFLVEPIQAEAGVIVPDRGYLRAVQEVCGRFDVLLCADEIQTGLGRTGALFAVEHEGVRPDLMCIGKALGGGLYPVSAVVGREDVMSVFTPGSHGSTFGGNPLASAVALEALAVIEDEHLVARARKLGKKFRRELRVLEDRPHVREVRGVGLMTAVEFETAEAHDRVERLMRRGVLAKETHGTTVRFTPPLVIEESDLLTAAATIVNVFGAPPHVAAPS